MSLKMATLQIAMPNKINPKDNTNNNTEDRKNDRPGNKVPDVEERPSMRSEVPVVNRDGR